MSDTKQCSKPKPRGYWTKERCIKEASRFSMRSEWQRKSKGSYLAAQRKGWLEDCCSFMESIDRSGDSGIKPMGYWTRERCIEEASRFSTRYEWQRCSRASYMAAHRGGWLDQCCEGMVKGKNSTDNNVIYIWRDSSGGLYKIGVTSDRIGEDRIKFCGGCNDMDPRIVLMLKVSGARAVESKLLELGTDPELDSSVDGYTEFRRLTDAELGRAVSIAYEAALAA